MQLRLRETKQKSKYVAEQNFEVLQKLVKNEFKLPIFLEEIVEINFSSLQVEIMKSKNIYFLVSYFRKLISFSLQLVI